MSSWGNQEHGTTGLRGKQEISAQITGTVQRKKKDITTISNASSFPHLCVFGSTRESPAFQTNAETEQSRENSAKKRRSQPKQLLKLVNLVGEGEKEN